jgi:hypothetical protein
MNKRFLFLGASVIGIIVQAAACGDDETKPTPAPQDGSAGDASNDTTAADTSAADTATTDTAISDVGADRNIEQTGSSCTTAAQCYTSLDAQSLKGAPACLDKVTDGYCTHECTTDDDCCAVPGECRTTFKQVCSSFENAGKKYCFLSCEEADIADAGVDAGGSGDNYCHGQLSTEFGCRSTGGGAQNRKVCLPQGAVGDGGPNDGGPKDAASDAATDALDAADAADG